jgi:hypothetical protein
MVEESLGDLTVLFSFNIGTCAASSGKMFEC